MIVTVKRRRRGLGQAIYDPSGDYGGFYPSPADNNAPLPRPAACSWTDYIWPTQACSLALGQQQIQSVPANAAAANAAAVAAGQAAPYNVPLIQSAANQQSTGLAADIPKLWATPITLSDVSTWPWYMWAGLAVGALWLVKR